MVSTDSDQRFLLADEVAQRLRCSLRGVHELTRTGRIPHVKLAGTRRCLFREEELGAPRRGEWRLDSTSPSGETRAIRRERGTGTTRRTECRSSIRSNFRRSGAKPPV
jgi:excisionase family DNA binding protein